MSQLARLNRTSQLRPARPWIFNLRHVWYETVDFFLTNSLQLFTLLQNLWNLFFPVLAFFHFILGLWRRTLDVLFGFYVVLFLLLCFWRIFGLWDELLLWVSFCFLLFVLLDPILIIFFEFFILYFEFGLGLRNFPNLFGFVFGCFGCLYILELSFEEIVFFCVFWWIVLSWVFFRLGLWLFGCGEVNLVFVWDLLLVF